MPTLIVQKGHCYRKTGATGTAGEQSYATSVADACVRLLDGRGGWRVRPTLADVDDYRADAFVAVHCDGSSAESARGASAGYQTPEGQAFGQAWKRAYAAAGWPVFRPDNYTTALANHYGVRNAVRAGTRHAIIIECGFMTNAQDRALMLGPFGPERVASAIGDALGIPHDLNSEPKQEDDMPLYLLQGGTSGPPSFTGVNVYLLAGPYLVGLDGDERTDALSAINDRGAAFQWVTRTTIDHLDARSHALFDKGPVVDAVKALASGQVILGQLTTQLLEATDQIRTQLADGPAVLVTTEPEVSGTDAP